MRSNAKQFERLKGRWVLTAINPWSGKRVFYRPKLRPLPQTILHANSYRSEKTARGAIFYMKKHGAILNWKPYKVKDTEMFLEVLKNG